MFTRRLLKIKIHSRRVQIFKRSLPIFAFLIAAVMLVWPALTEQKDKFTLPSKPSTAIKGAKIDMQAVRFFSKDDKNQPMTITASSVQETDPAKQIITLLDPKALYKMASGVVLNAVTTYGLAFQKDEYLYFDEEVTATTDTGWKAVSTKVVCDYKADTMESRTPIKITGPDGRLDASGGFILYNKGNNIDFKDQTHTIITSQKEPIDVYTKNGLKINQIDATITAIDDVKVLQNNQTITADKMVLYYKKQTQAGEDKIDRIEAFGNVVATNNEQTITGVKGNYDPTTGIITMKENVVLRQGQNSAKGDVVTLNLKTGVNSLTSEKKLDGTGGRVKGTLIPSGLSQVKTN